MCQVYKVQLILMALPQSLHQGNLQPLKKHYPELDIIRSIAALSGGSKENIFMPSILAARLKEQYPCASINSQRIDKNIYIEY